ncbi:glycosyltransferase [Vibrio alginolyticus]|uniref:glycosyltransferase n=1 Tax=Vibrio alginolyticus TaxID=663 RepID=UPI001BD44BFF|nr:glycosyltransferase [Vibrio alginolyticus]MBS9933701.1 glycosyltransferase [Vibrio alginolyticus]
MKDNIAFFVSGLDSGGLENYLLRFLKFKSKSYNNIYVFCKSGKGGQLEKYYLSIPNVNIIKIKIGYLDIRDVKKVTSFLKSKKIKIVCDFTGNFSGIILASAKILKIRKRVSFYRGSKDHYKHNFIKDIYNYFCKKLVLITATDILSNSRAAFEYFYSSEWKKDKRFSVIYNGIDPSSFLSETRCLRADLCIPQSAFVIGHTGRYNVAKNHSQIIRVAKEMTRRYQDVYFILCGNGVGKHLKKELESDGLSNKILVFENRNDIPKFLNTMDCYFFPSITEGQPNALIEAMIMGLPFVASNIQPIRETVGEGYHLYNPENTDELIFALEEVYRERPTRNENLQGYTRERFDYVRNFNAFGTILDS